MTSSASEDQTSTTSLTPAFWPEHPYAEFLHEVTKPARYTGGELGQCKKDWNAVEARVCLAFPDVYDIGMSHLGYKILYDILNKDPRTLAERAYAPWTDMEEQLRRRKLPLISHESLRPLRDFDVVGLSLQFELTYTNCLTILDLGGIPLRTADRGENDPLVLGGGPNATHPEPMAVFFDAFVVGDGERVCSEVALTWTRLKKAGVPRQQRLIALSQLQGVYVPSLYTVERDPESGLQVVTGTLHPEVPRIVRRALIENLADFPFPSQSPVGGPEAIFERMSVEIARGCTEGCRFCQAGMIYRPVRERNPEEIVNTLVEAVKQSGQDEVSLTSLSTADSSCIAPLVRKVVERLVPEGISLGVSSLRAYGLSNDVLDDISRTGTNGLTFAPEAGTQRMRDVINKNVTEEQLMETAERVFSRGWDRMKLYFMIGLPTEQEEDVLGIVETGQRAMITGRNVWKKANEEKSEKVSLRTPKVTVSVSTHVPKPHTPFQWCAMDSLQDVRKKQHVLREAAKLRPRVDLKMHDAEGSFLEGVFARGDRRLGDCIEQAWKNGARFDSWEEHAKLDIWKQAFTDFDIPVEQYLGTIPVSARLPWDHLDIGLEDGFLAREYRKALRSRLSPPCGKALGMFVHHTNKRDALEDQRRLVCYDCGVACDLGQMRQERVDFLDLLGAEKPRSDEPPAPEPFRATHTPNGPRVNPATAHLPVFRYRLAFQKLGPMVFLGHLDVIRAIPRVFRRLSLALVHTKGFHPKPDMVFAPALSLGVPSLGEFIDLKLHQEYDPERLVSDLNKVSPEGLHFTGAAKLGPQDHLLTKVIDGARYVLAFARQALPLSEQELATKLEAVMAKEDITVHRAYDRRSKMVNVRQYIRKLELNPPSAHQALQRAGIVGDLVAIEADLLITGSGAAKTSEVVEILLGSNDFPHRAIRVALLAAEGHSPLDLALLEQKPLPTPKGPALPTIEAIFPEIELEIPTEPLTLMTEN
jgi:radical SAM family uncharacterized protein/radical SAM-linked protein